VSKFFNRGDDLERELRRNRPEPRAEFLAALVGRERRSTARRLRVGFAGALTAAIVTALASFGGLSYAASGVESVARVATKIVTPKKPSKPHATQQLSSAAAQYPPKITICHRGHTITISQNALPAHIAHGDSVGACSAAVKAAAAKAAAEKAAAAKAAAEKAAAEKAAAEKAAAEKAAAAKAAAKKK